MKRFLLLFLLVAACDGVQADRNQAATRPAEGGAPGSHASPGKSGPPDSLVGLYEGGTGPLRSQLCMVAKGGVTLFALLVRGDAEHSCAGAGRAERSGGRLTLKMAGDEACTIDARLAEGRIAFPAGLPSGCAYYCARGARMDGASFTRTGSGEAEALKATDIAGDPLCG